MVSAGRLGDTNEKKNERDLCQTKKKKSGGGKGGSGERAKGRERKRIYGGSVSVMKSRGDS